MFVAPVDVNSISVRKQGQVGESAGKIGKKKVDSKLWDNQLLLPLFTINFPTFRCVILPN
jgi:hypothetical protein